MRPSLLSEKQSRHHNARVIFGVLQVVLKKLECFQRIKVEACKQSTIITAQSQLVRLVNKDTLSMIIIYCRYSFIIRPCIFCFLLDFSRFLNLLLPSLRSHTVSFESLVNTSLVFYKQKYINSSVLK